MSARIWMVALAATMLVSSSGCGSCRWHHRRAWFPSACVSPGCGDPACMVCSPVPPLYDGWVVQSQMFAGGGCGCGSCGEVIYEGECAPCGEVMGGCAPCGDGQMMGNSCGMPTYSGNSCQNCQQSAMMQASPMESTSMPTPAQPNRPNHSEIFEQSPGTYSQPKSEVPMGQPPAEPMDGGLAPEPPNASQTSGFYPSEYYAPNKRSAQAPAPLPMSGPMRMAPQNLETSLEMQPVEQTALRLPPLP